jgi:hypothetical protein
MCFNQTTSLTAFTISLICFIYLLYYGIKKNNKYDIFAAIVTIVIGLMQLLEFFLWRSQNCSQTNHNLSLLIIVLLYLQCIIGPISATLLFSSIKGNYLSYFVIALCIIFSIITFYALKWLNKEHLCSRPTKNSCRLAWAPYVAFQKSLKGFLYFLSFSSLYSILFYYSFLIGFFNFNNNFTKISINFEPLKYPIRYLFLPITYLLSVLYAFYYEGKNYIDILGSFWCFSAVAFGIISCLHI